MDRNKASKASGQLYFIQQTLQPVYITLAMVLSDMEERNDIFILSISSSDSKKFDLL